MKFIRIFLLILIIAGIWLIATQKSWAPKLANAIVTAEDLGVLQGIPSDSALEPHTVKAGEHCGGFIRTPGVCGVGFVCAPASSESPIIGDTGGICKKVTFGQRVKLFWQTLSSPEGVY